MSDVFSDLSRTLLNLAHAEAIRLDHVQVGPAHLLLAMLREPTNRPGEMLRRLTASRLSKDTVRGTEEHRRP